MATRTRMARPRCRLPWSACSGSRTTRFRIFLPENLPRQVWSPSLPLLTPSSYATDGEVTPLAIAVRFPLRGPLSVTGSVLPICHQFYLALHDRLCWFGLVRNRFVRAWGYACNNVIGDLLETLWVLHGGQMGIIPSYSIWLFI